MKYLLVMNPGSRSGKGQLLWTRYKTALDQAQATYECIETRHLGHACDIGRSVSDDIDVVVAVGGDGTINEVLDGAVQSGKPQLAMGVLYAGTSPDFCQFHGIPVDPDQALQTLLNGVHRKIDVVKVIFHKSDGEEVVSHLACSSNIGLGASVARISNRIRRYFGDTIGTGLALLVTILNNQRYDLKLKLDDTHLTLEQVNHLVVLKNPFIASGLKLDLDLKPDDGRLDVIAISQKTALGMCRLMPDFYTGRAVHRPDVLSRVASLVEVTADEPLEIEFDGDPRGYLPARFEIMPSQLSLICQDKNDE